MLDQDGPWTEEAYLALPRDRRIELVDGSLLVAPTTDDRHAAAVAAVRAAVEKALPEGLEVTGPVALRLCPGRILVPDLVVAARSEDGSDVRDGSAALVVIDVVGSGNGVADRWFKPQLYAGSRIPYAVLVDHDEPFAVATMLIGGRFHEYAHAAAGETFVLEEPFRLDLDLSGLSAPGGDRLAADDGVPEPAADGAGSEGAGPDDTGPDEDTDGDHLLRA